MENEVTQIAEGLREIIEREMPSDKTAMAQFIAELDVRFPEAPKTIRTIFEMVYEEKFNEKYIW